MIDFLQLIKDQYTEILDQLAECPPKSRNYTYYLGQRDKLAELLVTLEVMEIDNAH